MIQPATVVRCAIIFLIALGIGCDQSADVKPPATAPSRITVASLSPAATDLIVAMGLADRLVGVSTYEPPRPATDSLPRVGDYQTADWERISQLKPAVIVTQYRADKIPEGFIQRCEQLGIRSFNRKIDSLQDAYATIAELGDALSAKEESAAAQKKWNATIEDVKAKVAGKARAKTLLVIGESGLAAAGPGTFLSDLLTVAGGTNVLVGGNDYVTLDREKLAALDPAVVIQIMPSATPQQIEKAESFWKSMTSLRAVRDRRVHRIVDADALLPGFNCPALAARFADILHGERSAPSTRSSP